MARISKEKKEEIRKNIIEVSKKLIINNGYDNTSTSQIAAEVGIAEGTIFNYFKTKADIFLEVMSEGYFDVGEFDFLNYDISTGVVDIIMNHFERLTKKMFLIPKVVMIELALAIMGKAKTKPELVKKLVKLDFEFLEELIELLKDLNKRGLIITEEIQELGETIYAAIIFDMMLFLYEKDLTKYDAIKKIRKKIECILKGFIVCKE